VFLIAVFVLRIACQQMGWEVDSTSNMVLPVQKPRTSERSTGTHLTSKPTQTPELSLRPLSKGLDQLQQLSDYVIHLETQGGNGQ
jgi:hypothetical protein